MPEHEASWPISPCGLPNSLRVGVPYQRSPPQYSKSVIASLSPPLQTRRSFLGPRHNLPAEQPASKRGSIASLFSSSTTKARDASGARQDLPIDSHAWLERPFGPDSTHSRHLVNPSTSSPTPNPGFKRSSSHKSHQGLFELCSTTVPPCLIHSSNSPHEDHMAADEAFAKSLQAQEFQDAQMKRDRYLAYSLARGTANDEDIELAYFMARQTGNLIVATTSVIKPFPMIEAPTHISKKPATSPIDTLASAEIISADLSLDSAATQLQHDLLKARELEQQFLAENTIEEASFAEARRLQAEFDKDVENEDAWEAYKKSNIEECMICGDEQHRDELLRPCKHGWCEGCLQDGFKNALSSRTPLKCCKEVLRVQDCAALEDVFVQEYGEMMLELSTPNPIYCSNARCARFLPPLTIIGDVGTCKTCKTRTCRHCKKRLHPGTFCEEDQETMAVKELGKAKGWKTCPGCNHLIERQSGCLHIVCTRCQTAFCYRCSKPWKDCESTCPDGESPAW